MTYNSPSLSETPDGTTTQVPRVYLNIEEGLGVDILNLVDPRPQLPIFEDGRGGVGRNQGHV